MTEVRVKKTYNLLNTKTKKVEGIIRLYGMSINQEYFYGYDLLKDPNDSKSEDTIVFDRNGVLSLNNSYILTDHKRMTIKQSRKLLDIDGHLFIDRESSGLYNGNYLVSTLSMGELKTDSFYLGDK